MKGVFGEKLCSHFFTRFKTLKIHTINHKTPFGEIDLILKDTNGFLYPIEVKMLFNERLSGEIWSYQQRNRFLKSVFNLTRDGFRVKDYGLFLIYPDRLSYICSSDLFS